MTGTARAPRRGATRLKYRKLGAGDYLVLWNGHAIGRVWKAAGSGWYCDAGNAGFTNRTRWRATLLLCNAQTTTRPADHERCEQARAWLQRRWPTTGAAPRPESDKR